MTNNKLEEVHYYQSIRKRQLSTDTNVQVEPGLVLQRLLHSESMFYNSWAP